MRYCWHIVLWYMQYGAKMYFKIENNHLFLLNQYFFTLQNSTYQFCYCFDCQFISINFRLLF